MNDDLAKLLIKRLDAWLSVQFRPIDNKATDQERIKRLDSFDFTPSEIAAILGSTSEKISKQLYVIRNKKGGRSER